MKINFTVMLKIIFCTIITLSSLHSFCQENPLFEKVSSKHSKVSFTNKVTETSDLNIFTYGYLYNGAGVAIGDINNDGLEDLYFTGNMTPDKLYLNRGNFQFEDITKKAGISKDKGWKTGTSMADVNGDGFLDIYVSYSGNGTHDSRRNKLYINKGNLFFEEQAQDFGLDDPSQSTQASFFDFDLDGDLDMYLLNHNVELVLELEYDEIRNTRHPFAGDKLFRNDNGYFVDISEAAGIIGSPLGFGLGVSTADINQDGWPDIYVANDYTEPDYLYINNKDGTYTNRLEEYLRHTSYFSMGSDIQDINNDGWTDILSLDMLPEDNERQKLLYGPDNYEHHALRIQKGYYHQTMRNMLHINNANGTFSEIGQLSGVSNTDWSWAPLIADFDNDGWKDIFVTNGYLKDFTNRDFLKYKGDYFFQQARAGEKADSFQLVNSMESTPIRNYVFKNEMDNTFSDKSVAWGIQEEGFSNGAAYADLDNDGDLDLVISNQNEKASVYKNTLREHQKNHHFLTLDLKGSGRNTLAIGGKVYIYAESKVQFQELYPVRGFQSTVSSRLHFGLGAISVIDSIRIKWPSGNSSLLQNVKTNQLLTIKEEDFSALPISLPLPKEKSIFLKEQPLLTYFHREPGFNDFKRQPLLMTMISPCGPKMAVGDIDGDSLEDIFVCGTMGNPGRLFIQQQEGSFKISSQFVFPEEDRVTDADVSFQDIDNDGDLDIYIASGGYHDYFSNDVALQDRLYINNGEGLFVKSEGLLPEMKVSKSCIRSFDFDKDGDVDIFVGGKSIPGKFPLPAPSYLLLNDGKGKFTNVINEFIPEFQGGIVNDAVWTDVNSDGWMDLVIVGEFMPVKVFINENGKSLKDNSISYFKTPVNGLWSAIISSDFDNDGDEDLIIGNFGLNSQIKASQEEPVTLYYDDFDDNGSVDPLLNYYVQGKSFPFLSRDELLDQMYKYRKVFNSYKSYSNITIEGILNETEIEKANKLSVNNLSTTYFENTPEGFVSVALPVQAQYAPVYALAVLDFNKDGNKDIIMAGNQSALKIRMGSIDANYGQLYKGDGKGNFEYVSQTHSGLSFLGDVKSLRMISINGEDYLLPGINNSGIETYKLIKK